MSDQTVHNRYCGKPQPATRADARVITSSALFGAERRICIEHNGELYQLTITANDKLILTK